MKNPSQLAREFVAHGKAALCPIIDMHTHPGPYQRLFFPNAEPDRMIESMDRAGVRMACGSAHCAFVDTSRGNAYMENIIRRFPERFRGYWVVNPNYPERLKREAADLENHEGFVGFKFHPSWHAYPLDGPAYEPALEYANGKKLLILIHTWGHSQYNSPKQVEKLARRYPHAIFLMAHCGYGEWDWGIRLGREYPNVYLELTGAHDANGIIEKMVTDAGSENMLYGTDLPWFDPHYVIGCILFARITDEDRHNILHRNAESLLTSITGLEAQRPPKDRGRRV